MKEGTFVNTSLTRRHFHKLLTILEECREAAAGSVEYCKKKDDKKEELAKAMNRVRDLDMIIEALCEEG